MSDLGYERLIDKLKEIGMSESDITEFLRLKAEVDEMWERPGRYAGSRSRAIDRRYDLQSALLNKYRG